MLGILVPLSPGDNLRVTRSCPLLVAAALALLIASDKCAGQETAAAAPVVDQIQSTNSVQITTAFLELQEHVRATQQAIEQNREESKQAAAQTATTLSNALQTVQASFAAQRARDLEAIQEANQVILRVAGAFGAVGFLALLTIGFLQWRLSQGLIEISSSLSSGLALAAPPAATALGSAEASGPALLNALERPEKQTPALEQANRPASKPRKRLGRSLEQRLFPKAGDSLRRRQFRALKTALALGLICAAAVAVVLYLVYVQPRP